MCIVNKLRNFSIGFIILGFISISRNAQALSLVEVSLNLNLNVNLPANITSTQNSPVNVIYTETDKDFELIVTTNSLFDPDEDYKFDIKTSEDWDIALTFNFQDGFLEDEDSLELKGTVFHDTKPRGSKHDDDRDRGDTFQISFPSFNLETQRDNPNWLDNEIVFNKPNNEDHKPKHTDIYSPNSLTITRDSQDFDEMSSFSYRLEGKHSGRKHSVPEPLTIFGTFTALGFGALFKKKKLSSKAESSTFRCK